MQTINVNRSSKGTRSGGIARFSAMLIVGNYKVGSVPVRLARVWTKVADIALDYMIALPIANRPHIVSAYMASLACNILPD